MSTYLYKWLVPWKTLRIIPPKVKLWRGLLYPAWNSNIMFHICNTKLFTLETFLFIEKSVLASLLTFCFHYHRSRRTELFPFNDFCQLISWPLCLNPFDLIILVCRCFNQKMKWGIELCYPMLHSWGFKHLVPRSLSARFPFPARSRLAPRFRLGPAPRIAVCSAA